MKTTKLLIGAMAVMSFAACQNDALVAEQPSVESRKQIDVKIVPTEGVDSRMINNNGSFSWETTDKLGAAMVDVAKQGKLANGSHFGNAQFNYAEGAFTTSSTLSVGSYVFYYPYDAENTTSRGGVIVKTLGAQKFDTTGDEMMKNNFMVAPVTLIEGAEAGELTLPMTFRSIYGYGDLTLTNNLNEEEDLEIQKIVIEHENFVIGGKLQVAQFNATSSTDKTNTHDIANLFVTVNEDVDAAKVYAKADSVYLNKVTEDGKTVKPAAVKWVNGTPGSVSIDCLTGTTGVQLAYGASVSTRVLIPAGSYEKSGLKIYVYTNKGVTEISGEAIETTEEEADETNGFVVVRNSRTKTINAEITEYPDPQTEINVISKEDFIASMAQFEDSDDVLSVSVAAGVEVDAEMLAAIPADVPYVTFTSNVTVNASTTLKKVVFATGKTVTLKGNVTIQPVLPEDVEMFNYNNVKVEGTVKVAKSIKANFNVDNNATLNLNAGVNVNEIISEGTLNIGSASGDVVELDGNLLVNGGVLNAYSELSAATLILGGNTEEAKAVTATVYKNITSRIYVNKSASLTANVEKIDNANALIIDKNQGTIVNNKSIEVKNNTGKITNAAGAELNVSTKNAGTIDNSGTAKVQLNQGADAKHIATINQVAGTAKVVIENNKANAVVNTWSGSTTTVQTSNAGGEVVYVEGAKLAVNAKDGNVSYEAETMTPENLTAFAEAKQFINKVVFTADYASGDKAFTIPATIKTLVFKGDATFSKAFASTTAEAASNATAINKAEADAVNLVFNGDVTFTEGASFPEGANITFDGGNTLAGKSISVGRTAASDGKGQINAYLVWNIVNGELTNECPVNATNDTFVVNFLTENEDLGQTAGTIWNDRVIKATSVVYRIDGVSATNTNEIINALWNGTSITDL